MTAARRRALDPITFELVHAALLSAAEEMGGVLKRSSYSPIIRDMEDFSCAIFAADGDLVAQADYIPAQLGAMSLVVKSILTRWGSEIADGDVFMANHPFLGAMHTPDINIITPVFVGGRLFGWTGATAHHLDVGGVNPGTEGPALEQVYAEGLVLAPVRLYLAGRENRDVISILTENIRDPLSTISDLRAQRAACLLGSARLRETIERWGAPTVRTVFRQALDAAERAVRAALAELPDGEGEAEGFMDDDGRGGPPTRIHVRLSKRGDELAIDLSGCAPQVAGALNVPWASTRAGLVYAVRVLTDPHLSSNEGVLRPLHVVCPLGNVLNPRPPAAVSVRHNTCQRLADTIVRAAAEIWPEKAVGGSSVAFFGINVESVSPVTGHASVLSDVVGGGTGAHRGGDGIDGVDTYMSNVGLMPVEVAETNYSVRIERTELIAGSQGPGTFEGGMGIRRDYRVLDRPHRATFYGEQTIPEFRPRGVRGGGDAAPTNVLLFDPQGRPVPVPPKVSTTLEAGSLVRVETSGGGGYGPPEGRAPGLRDADRADARLP
ncbi:MAG: hydantoinase B/oxoprolinase family protein [Actinobacteria bacterium]|nr:hydantoinase B/oxoprolinase family protein [Actinomycetota bacterium]